MKNYIAEFLGTYVLVTVGTGTIALTNADPLTVSLAFGLAFMVCAYTFGSYSGGHFNPAITLGMAINHQISWPVSFWYIVAQLAAGIGAAATVRAAVVATGGAANFLGQNTTKVDDVSLVVIEAVLTTMLVLVYLMTKKQHQVLGGLINGFALTVISIAGYNLTGPSLNPARSLGPALFAGGDSLVQLWLYVLGSVLGAGVAALLMMIFDRETPKKEKQ